MVADEARDGGSARHVVRRRADRGAALGARQHLDAPLRRSLVGVRVRLDAHPRRAPPPRLRPRLRAVRSRRLGRARATPSRETGAERVFVTHGYTEQLARFSSNAGVEPSRGARSTKASPKAQDEPSRQLTGPNRKPERRDVKRFAELYDAHRSHDVDQREGGGARAAISRDAPPADAAWALFFLTGRRLKRHLPTRLMHAWTLELTGLPRMARRGVVCGRRRLRRSDRAAARRPRRAVATGAVRRHVRPGSRPAVCRSTSPTRAAIDDARRRRHAGRMDRGSDSAAARRWTTRSGACGSSRGGRASSGSELFLLNKLLTGEFRVGVSHTLVVRAVAQLAALPTGGRRAPADGKLGAVGRRVCRARRARGPGRRSVAAVSRSASRRRFEGDDQQRSATARRVAGRMEVGRHPRAADPSRRRGVPLVARRGADHRAASRRSPRRRAALPDGTVLDGEMLAFARRRRRGRLPICSTASGAQRQRARGCGGRAGGVPRLRRARGRRRRHSRRCRCANAATASRCDVVRGGAAGPMLRRLGGAGGADLGGARARCGTNRARGSVEGLMLKRWTSPYRPGRKRGDWWKWKIEPFTIDAVLIYAQPGSGRRASLFTDYTFGVWDDGELVPVAKAYSGLTDEEIDELDRWVRRHTTERFGPVSAVEPVHVFELGFERIARVDSAQIRGRRPLSPHAALAPRQDRRAKPTRSETLTRRHGLDRSNAHDSLAGCRRSVSAGRARAARSERPARRRRRSVAGAPARRVRARHLSVVRRRRSAALVEPRPAHGAASSSELHVVALAAAGRPVAAAFT